MSPEDEIRVLELIAKRPVNTIAVRVDESRLSRRQQRRNAELRYLIKQELDLREERTERRERQAVVNAVMKARAEPSSSAKET